METAIMENQMEKKMENELETGIINGVYRQLVWTEGVERNMETLVLSELTYQDPVLHSIPGPLNPKPSGPRGLGVDSNI